MNQNQRFNAMLRSSDPHTVRLARKKIDEMKQNEKKPSKELGKLAQIVKEAMEFPVEKLKYGANFQALEKELKRIREILDEYIIDPLKYAYSPKVNIAKLNNLDFEDLADLKSTIENNKEELGHIKFIYGPTNIVGHIEHDIQMSELIISEIDKIGHKKFEDWGEY